MDAIHTEGMKFVDSEGRECIFSGVNLVEKGKAPKFGHGPRKYKFKDYDEKTVAELKEHGMNVVRLGLTWDGVEPAPGRYDEEYLEKVAKIARLLENHGIYFFLDMHQDLYGSDSKIGDGAPAWAALTDGEKFKKPMFIWAEGYFYGRAVQKSFDAFWLNREVCGKGLQDWYTDMWKHVAAKFKDNTALLGFDIMNEPYPGTDGGKVFTYLLESALKACEEKSGNKHKSLSLAGCFDGKAEKKGFARLGLKMAGSLRRKGMIKALREMAAKGESFHAVVLGAADIIKKFDTECYTPFMNRVTSGIREVTDRGIIFMENSYYSNLGIPYCAEPVTVGGEREKNLAFAPHGYDLLVDSPLYKYASSERTDSIFNEHIRSQERLQMPVLVGEFGGFTNGTEWLPHLEHLCEFFDENKWSRTYWAYHKKFAKSPAYDTITRCYPQRVNGEIKSFKYNAEKRVFNLEFTSRGADIPSVVYLCGKPKKIEADCRTIRLPFGKNACILELDAEKGEHKIRVELE